MLECEDRRVARQKVQERRAGSVPIVRPLRLVPNRHQFDGGDALNRPLGGRIEGAETLKVVTEELRAHREFIARTPGVDNAATNRIITLLLNSWYAIIAKIRQFCADICESEGVCPQSECGDRPLRDGGSKGGERGNHHARVGGQTPGFEGGEGFEAGAEGGLVAREQGRKLQDAGLEGGGGGRVREQTKIVN